MTKHKNLSIFVPHEGCPNQCSFCDQHSISGAKNAPKAEYVTYMCDKFLPKDNGESYEIAFFGGSFTAINREYMLSLLQAAYPFVQAKRAVGIRISTRPDAISQEILTILKQYGVTSIELGAQSMQDSVLKLNLRGHTVEDVYRAGAMIKENGFSLGLQMMTGLYGQTDYCECAVDTARQFIEIMPQTVRIYPTLTLKNTLLAQLYAEGKYIPPTVEQSVGICAKIIPMFTEKGITIIKLGLHADTGLEQNLVAGPYHQAFRELCLSHIFLEKFKNSLTNLPKGNYIISVNPAKISQSIGQGRKNITQLKQQGYNVKIVGDKIIENYNFKICKSEGKQCI